MLVRLAVLCVSTLVPEFRDAFMPARSVCADDGECRYLFPIIQRVIGSPSAQDHRQGLYRSQEGFSSASTQSCKARLSDTRHPDVPTTVSNLDFEG